MSDLHVHDVNLRLRFREYIDDRRHVMFLSFRNYKQTVIIFSRCISDGCIYVGNSHRLWTVTANFFFFFHSVYSVSQRKLVKQAIPGSVRAKCLICSRSMPRRSRLYVCSENYSRHDTSWYMLKRDVSLADQRKSSGTCNVSFLKLCRKCSYKL